MLKKVVKPRLLGAFVGIVTLGIIIIGYTFNALGLDAAIEKISDMGAIAKMGIMSTPALAIDGKVKCVGRVLTKEQVKGYLTESNFVAL